MIDTPDGVKNTNLHNTTIWHAADGQSHLLFPGNEANKVFVMGLGGKLKTTLTTPDGGRSGKFRPNDYFKASGKFVPTDVEQLDGKLYIATGYSKLDYVLTARILKTSPPELSWNNLSFGGKGTEPGQFNTGHGIRAPKMKRLDIADRANGEIDRFSPNSKYFSTVNMPKDSFPCDTYFLGKYVAVASLNNPDKAKGAAVYILENDKVISTILPKEELASRTSCTSTTPCCGRNRQEILRDCAGLESRGFRNSGASPVGDAVPCPPTAVVAGFRRFAASGAAPRKLRENGMISRRTLLQSWVAPALMGAANRGTEIGLATGTYGMKTMSRRRTR